MLQPHAPLATEIGRNQAPKEIRRGSNLAQVMSNLILQSDHGFRSSASVQSKITGDQVDRVDKR